MGGGHVRTRPRFLELRRQASLVLGPAGRGHGPAVEVGEARAADPPQGLVVEEQLLDDVAIQAESARHRRPVGHPLDPHTVQDE